MAKETLPQVSGTNDGGIAQREPFDSGHASQRQQKMPFRSRRAGAVLTTGPAPSTLFPKLIILVSGGVMSVFAPNDILSSASSHSWSAFWSALRSALRSRSTFCSRSAFWSRSAFRSAFWSALRSLSTFCSRSAFWSRSAFRSAF
jgi:hypothetical protein